MVNHHFQWVNPLQMAIFNSYVSHYQRVPRVMIKGQRTGGAPPFNIMKHPMKNPHSTTVKFVIEPFFEPLFPIILAASISSRWRFGTFFIFPYIGFFIIPTDFHIFQRGRYTSNLSWNPHEVPLELLYLFFCCCFNRHVPQRKMIQVRRSAAERSAPSRARRVKRARCRHRRQCWWMTWWSTQRWGVLRMPHFSPDGMAHPFILNIHTYTHTYTYIYNHVYIYMYVCTYMYLNKRIYIYILYI